MNTTFSIPILDIPGQNMGMDNQQGGHSRILLLEDNDNSHVFFDPRELDAFPAIEDARS